MKHLLLEVLRIAETELNHSGFRKVKGIFVLPIRTGIVGWLGLNTITRRSDGKVGINPVVGVRHEAIEKMIDRLISQNDSVAPTISTSLGYLMPESRYFEWLFQAAPFDYHSESKQMVKAVEAFGVPFMEANSTLENILNDLDQLRFSVIESKVYRFPVACLLSGKVELAEAYVRQQILDIGDRHDLAAERYKTFAEKFLEASLKKAI